MTKYVTQTQTCCLCGTENECELVESTEADGSPDLDLRPAAPERDSMHCWFQECQNCHYVGVDLAQASDNASEITKSPEYQSLIADSQTPKTARKFALCALLNQTDREIFGLSLIHI